MLSGAGQADAAETDRILSLLRQAPERIAALSSGLENDRLARKPDEAGWSANDILAHLRSCADVWGKSILAMLAQDHPTLRYVSPRTWARKTIYPTRPFHASLADFTRQRAGLLRVLEALPAADWSRGATFTGTTSGKEHTVLSYALRISQHEAEHLAQLEQMLAPGE